MLKKKFKKDERAMREARERLMPEQRGAGVKHADIIIEAIFENKDVKQKL